MRLWEGTLMKNMRSVRAEQFLLIIFFLLLWPINSWAQSDENYIPSSSSIRPMLIETWFSQDLSTIRSRSSEILQNDVGDYFLVRAEERQEYMEIIVAPLVLQTLSVLNIDLEDGMLVETDDESEKASGFSDKVIETWPKEGLGSWILYRDIETGMSEAIRYYFTNDAGIYIEFLKKNDKVIANFSVHNALVAYNTPVPLELEYFYTASIEEVQSVTRNILPWKYTTIANNTYYDITQMLAITRGNLLSVQREFARGNLDNLTFLKWLVDGIVKPRTGNILFDEPLREPTLPIDYAFPFRNETYKSYDYVRNLAAAALSADTSVAYDYNSSSAEVSIEPFSVYINDNNDFERISFSINYGYQIEILKPILYILTVTEPGIFFLGAIRELDESSSLGKASEQYYYNDAVAIFTWFDSTGEFQISVLKDGVEYTFEHFLNMYPDTFMYLSRVKATTTFYPEEFTVEE